MQALALEVASRNVRLNVTVENYGHRARRRRGTGAFPKTNSRAREVDLVLIEEEGTCESISYSRGMIASAGASHLRKLELTGFGESDVRTRNRRCLR